MDWLKGRICFNRHELAGSFGDIGTDLPLVIGLVLACGLDGGGVFILFGSMQILTGLLYGLPMPVQPLKAMAALAISQSLSPGILYGGGLAIGLLMLVLTATGLLSRLARVIPLPVVRGLQLGLGASLALLAVTNYVPADGLIGCAFAAVALIVILLLRRNRYLPAALVVMAIGLVYAVIFNFSGVEWDGLAGLAWPQARVPLASEVWSGLVLLALPQLALSLGNSVIATERTICDLFPDRLVTIRKIGLTYSLMNIANPFFGGIGVCHGSGGLAGHHAFGARTGGSVVIYGLMYLCAGLFLSKGLGQVFHIFPLSILGVMLLCEGVAIMWLAREMLHSRRNMLVALVVAGSALTLPSGYLIGLAAGTLLAWTIKSKPKPDTPVAPQPAAVGSGNSSLPRDNARLPVERDLSS